MMSPRASLSESWSCVLGLGSTAYGLKTQAMTAILEDPILQRMLHIVELSTAPDVRDRRVHQSSDA